MSHFKENLGLKNGNPCFLGHLVFLKIICIMLRQVKANSTYRIIDLLNPIPAGALENQDMLGGAPPLNPMFDVQI